MEALALSFADNADAKLETMREALDAAEKSGKSTEESKSQGPTSETKTTGEETKKNSEESKKSETASQEPSIGKGPDEATGSDDNGPGNIVD